MAFFALSPLSLGRVLAVAVPLFTPGCTPALKQDARTIVHLAPDACVVIDSLTPSPAAHEGCVLARDLQPFFEDLLSAERLAAAHVAASAMPDAGRAP